MRKAQIFLSWHNAKRIRMALAATPALNTYHIVAMIEHTKLDSLRKSPLKTSVDVFLPISLLEVRLLLWEEEWIDAAVKVRILQSRLAADKILVSHDKSSREKL